MGGGHILPYDTQTLGKSACVLTFKHSDRYTDKGTERHTSTRRAKLEDVSKNCSDNNICENLYAKNKQNEAQIVFVNYGFPLVTTFSM